MNEGKLPEWLHCNKCNAFINSLSNDSRLYILECTHIVCKKCAFARQRQSGNVLCPVCGTTCAAKCIGGDELPHDVQLFMDQSMVLSELDRLRYCVQVTLLAQLR
ncbi:hypothetical protein IW139_003688 [Coemansia sp. RSA 353]|nr:hypothetical protein LPJ58_001512 [Coemansia sp. RSA 1591]KAJ1765034.1 hypothetical protein LPJ69_001499 [Coemansia sp. RSA 1752]KAJ1768240.1 hypothetical protein LPJ54_005073 [Coemansia sp. RSA 1824]KAJ1791898.1 hypothetical protein LPJ62_001146 [Coemansia sp. RSA 2167]KAJ1792802.1 hypothetical protein LPJ67_001449 [Coemansia sp. RSA 1938]KAJ2141332.1 hypothetical protein IW142_004915 [Coemansia sp. RSA 564]KAJ2152800.1 hypothetical protein J3F82_002431 [Coemansia sp. RSA 637]KAJ2164666.